MEFCLPASITFSKRRLVRNISEPFKKIGILPTIGFVEYKGKAGWYSKFLQNNRHLEEH